MTSFDIEQLLGELKTVVDKAGDIVKEAATKKKTITLKGRIDLVTETDVAVESFLKEALSKLLPESDYLAEETAKDTIPGDLTWIIDPVDGTTNFAHGLPFVANSVALWHEDKVVIGVVNLPLMGELFSVGLGQGAYMNGVPITVSDSSTLEESLLATGFPYAINEHLDEIMTNLKTLLPLTRGIRRPGAAAMDLAYVACGRFDGFYESALNPWDTAAGVLLVQEAGGQVSQFQANKEYVLGAPNVLATNGAIHNELSRLLVDS